MTRKINEGDFFSIRIADSVFYLVSARENKRIMVFDIWSRDNKWSGTTVDNSNVLFRVNFIHKYLTKELSAKKISMDDIASAQTSDDRKWIKPYNIMDKGHFPEDWEPGMFAFIGGRLVQAVPPMFSDWNAPVLIHDLQPETHREIIENYELTSIWDVFSLRERLLRYHETGINRDDLKYLVFPELWDNFDQVKPLSIRIPVGVKIFRPIR